MDGVRRKVAMVLVVVDDGWEWGMIGLRL